jgi:hypothetical protein
VFFRKGKKRTMWEELDENAYFVPQLGDVRDLAWRGTLVERLVAGRVRVMGESNEVRRSIGAEVIGDTDSG